MVSESAASSVLDVVGLGCNVAITASVTGDVPATSAAAVRGCGVALVLDPAFRFGTVTPHLLLRQSATPLSPAVAFMFPTVKSAMSLVFDCSAMRNDWQLGLPMQIMTGVRQLAVMHVVIWDTPTPTINHKQTQEWINY